jgi:hypothetical protein
MFYFVDKSGANQRHVRAACDVFLFCKALQKAFSTGWAIYETPQACHSYFLPHKRRRLGRGFMA